MDANKTAAAAATTKTTATAAAVSEPKTPPAPPKREPKIPIRSAAAPKEIINWQAGDKLNHKKWGIGTVMVAHDDSITVTFANPEIGTKTIRASLAPIEKV